MSHVRADGADWNDSDSRSFNSLKQVHKVINRGLVESSSVAVISVSGGEVLWVNHDNSETISVKLLLHCAPNSRARNVFKVGSVQSIAGLRSNREVPQIRVDHVVERRIHLNAAGDSGETDRLHGTECSIVEVVVWQDKGGWSNSGSGLND